MLATGLIIFLVYTIRTYLIKNFKARYDYINNNEIKNYKLVFLCLGLATAMIINLYGMNKVNEMGVWFFVRLFISIAGGTLVSYVSFLVLDFYYPTVLVKKLDKWRYTPRVNQQTGKQMRLLSEEEEDVHLEEGMKAEENVFSIDYDVWVDDETGDVQVEKYEGRLQAYKCNSCGFHTMKVVREEIVQQPVNGTPGELIKHFECRYCKSVRATAFKISTKELEDYKISLSGSASDKGRYIELIRIEVHSSLSGTQFFEFQNIDQAQKFLSEYEEVEEERN